MVNITGEGIAFVKIQLATMSISRYLLVYLFVYAQTQLKSAEFLLLQYLPVQI
ncbi:hypothetical protein NIES4073_17030 [Kalymmatonema gypsitolerans NIES-4073]|nr:hypothetical protein NIES4073_17030 [Scytonema sp. NIES-4073]